MANTNFSVEKVNFTDFQKLGNSLMSDLLTNGAFRLVYPDTITEMTYRATFETTLINDPLSPAQAWRFHVDCSGTVSPDDPGYIRLYVTHPLQLPDDGQVATEYAGDTTGAWARQSGEVTCGYFTGSGTAPGGQAISPGMVTIPFASLRWSGQTDITAPPTDENAARPVAYRLTVTDKGFVLFVWEEAQDDYGSKFSWITVQRPVDPITGATLASGKAPVFCMYSIGGGLPKNPDPLLPENASDKQNVYQNKGDWYDSNPLIYRFTVREADVFRPTIPVLATVSSPDNHAVINGKQQVSINEQNQYVVTFPTGFNTDRYMYKHEMDLTPYTSADVIGMWSDVSITVYGENTARRYKAMHSNLPNGVGLRILVMVFGPGFEGWPATP